MLKCPICKGLIEELEFVDTRVEPSKVTLFIYGECSQCGKSYQWFEDYAYTGYHGLEQTENKN